MSTTNDPTMPPIDEAAMAAAAIADATAPPVPPSPLVASGGGTVATTPSSVIPAGVPRFNDSDLHRHDVLSGRGGYVNAHPGNHHARTLCAHRKPEWDAGTNATKRRIAIEIHGMIRSLSPPGRFLRKEVAVGGRGGPSGRKGRAEEASEEVSATATAAAVAAEVIDGAAADAEASAAAAAAAMAAGDTETAAAIMAPTAAAAAQARAHHAGAPWVELNEEKSIQKVMQVMRDYKRSDRTERDNKPGKRKRANLPRGGLDAVVPNESASADGYDEQMRNQHAQAAAAAQAYAASAPEASDEEIYAAGCTNGIVPTKADVLMGRGAFINDHPGNKYWRALAKERKARFDAADQSDKREIAMEIVKMVADQAPAAGRFLRKTDPPAPVTTAGDDKKKAEVKASRLFALTPRGLQGPWEVMSEQEARTKTVQTLRDMGREKKKKTTKRLKTSHGASAAPRQQEPDYTKPMEALPGLGHDAVPQPVVGDAEAQAAVQV